jgi:hypothetical protein
VVGDQGLFDQLSALTAERFEGEVFRTTSISADPVAFSVNGGRWAPPSRDGAVTPVFYTSMERDGALAEVVSYLMQLTPLPLSRPLKVSRLRVLIKETLRVDHIGLERLGVDLARWKERDYSRTQDIGAAIALLGRNGLIAPSARWQCDNLMIYQANRPSTGRLEVIEAEHVDWGAWAREKGYMAD